MADKFAICSVDLPNGFTIQHWREWFDKLEARIESEVHQAETIVVYLIPSKEQAEHALQSKK